MTMTNFAVPRIRHYLQGNSPSQICFSVRIGLVAPKHNYGKVGTNGKVLHTYPSTYHLIWYLPNPEPPEAQKPP